MDECQIIAEMGAEHQQSYQKAVAIFYAAKEAGADGVKVSMFTPDDMTFNRQDEHFTIKDGRWSGTLYALYQKACMPYDWIPKLKKLAEDLELMFIVSVYHPDTVDIAEEMGIQMYKVASFEINFLDLIKKLDKTNKPVIVSTGSATYKEVESLFKILRRNLLLLKCTSEYPAPIDSLNLQTIPALKHIFKVPVGFSDHTTGIVAPVVAVSIGADMIEKHITLDGKGLDGDFAIMPDRFNVMVQTIREAEKALGKVDYGGKRTFHRQLVDGKMVRTVA